MTKRRWMAVLFSPDGDWVFDYRDSESVGMVWDRVADQGSRWIFYPYVVVIRDHGNGFVTNRARIVDSTWPWEDVKGRTLLAFSRTLAETPLDYHLAILA